jgi:serine/threonine protein kinase
MGARDTPESIDSRYLLRKEVGRGAYGKVYLATDTVGGMDVAIKVVDGVFNSTTDAKRTLREMTILRQCDHKNVARCHTVLAPPASARQNFNHIWYILELAATDLGNLIKRPSLRMAWSQRHVQLIIYQALQGLQYMHHANSALHAPLCHRRCRPRSAKASAIAVSH